MIDGSAQELQPELCRLPILVGVTGHRDLSDWGRDPVKATVRSILEKLMADFGDSTPIIVVSALAKGADQIAAEAALDIGLKVRAILPVSPARLEADDFNAHAAAMRILEDPATEAIDLSAFPELEAALHAAASSNPQWLDELRYEQAGLAVARHSHILLALVHPDYVAALSPLAAFQPDRQAPFGGSRRVMEFWVTGRLDNGVVGVSPLTPSGSLLRPVLTGPLIHIAAPRDSKHETPATAKFAPGKLTPLLPARRLPAEPGKPVEESTSLVRYLGDYFGKGEQTFHLLTDQKQGWRDRLRRRMGGGRRAVLPRLAAFNEKIPLRPSDASKPKAIARSLRDLVGQSAMQQLAAAWLPEKAQQLAGLITKQRHLFAGADGLANTYHEQLKLADKLILGAVPLAVLVFELFVEVIRIYPVLVVYVAVFLTALGAYWSVRITDLQDWYQDCRLVGEAARVQFFWSLAGLPRSVADEHQANELGEGSWLYAAIKAAALQGLALAEKGRERDFVLREWLGGPLSLPQPERNPYCYRDWYPAAAESYRRRYKFYGRAQTSLFASGIAIAVLTILLMIVGSDEPSMPWMEAIKMVLIVSIPTLPALGAVFGLWRERRAFEVHAHEYQRMHEIVSEGLTLLEKRLAEDPAGQAEVMYAIGREALHEGARWLLAHRQQPIRPVSG